MVLHRSPFPSKTATWNDDGDNSSYTLTEAPTPLPSATTPPYSPYIKLVYEAGNASAVWPIGNNALCKVRYIEEGVAPESVTLNFVRDQRPSFEVPKVLHHAFGNDRSYLFLQRVPGRTLDAAWPTLNEYWRRHYVNAVVNVCKEMAQWKGHVFGIIDFEIAGYFPRSWIRTKLRISSGMDLSHSVTDDPSWWRREVQRALGANGFDDVRKAWEEWRGYQPS